MDDPLVVFAARLRTLDIRRKFTKGGQPRRDAMCHANFVDDRVRVLHLDGLVSDDAGWQGDGDVGLRAAWYAAMVTTAAMKHRPILVGEMLLEEWG